MLKHTLVALAALGTALTGFSATGASAFPVVSQPVAQVTDPGLLLQVNHRHHYRHHHRGISPWWILPFVGAGIALSARDRYYDDGYYDGYGSRHVRWCLDRYRSYDPRTNTWVSYSGAVRQCISPYGP